MRYQLVIFDWDGTLMDSALKIVRCFQAAAKDVSLPIPAASQVHSIIGLGLTEAVDALFPDHDHELRYAALDRYREHFLNLDKTEMPLFRGVVDGLVSLSKRGIQLAVATGKSRRGLDRILRETQIQDLFSATRCSDETISKPHPQMILELLEITGVEPDNAVMVGDTEFDMEMARRANVDPVAVTYGVHDHRRLANHTPVAYFDTFPEVTDWLLGDDPEQRKSLSEEVETA